MEVPSRSDQQMIKETTILFIIIKENTPIIDKEMKNPICNYGYRNAAISAYVVAEKLIETM